MDVDAHNTCSPLSEDQSNDHRVPNPASASSLLRKHASTSADSYSSREGQDKYAAMMGEMQEMSNALDKINANLRKASVKCHTLIVDVATLFNPETEEMARNVVEDCEVCKNKVKAMLASEDLLSQK
ncbi:uncharacterized protein LOC116303445 [Actinia tenebrosa]|uniref:Uncharacterized protein LOC116303445 n=1 Tax=Actinia tenebrosa TaxID=6105 RepID=A0A6P8IPP3_ACTTE|nr:uncharacterized protein LOC116303445 [Actinia tenebrosa]